MSLAGTAVLGRRGWDGGEGDGAAAVGRAEEAGWDDGGDDGAWGAKGKVWDEGELRPGG